jgi:hypothetical protein
VNAVMAQPRPGGLGQIAEHFRPGTPGSSATQQRTSNPNWTWVSKGGVQDAVDLASVLTGTLSYYAAETTSIRSTAISSSY